MILYNMVAGMLSYFNGLCISLPLLAEDSPTGLYFFLIRSQMTMHSGGYTFDLEKQISMFLRDFGWDIHVMTLKIIKITVKVKWMIVSKSYSFLLDSTEEHSFERTQRDYAYLRFTLAYAWDVIHPEEVWHSVNQSSIDAWAKPLPTWHCIPLWHQALFSTDPGTEFSE